ncbi:MAG TPA: hypothetical protein VHX37_01990 [Acidobacteriaceae bacterium]|jgi:hypothetical protein|nr:hypothetical protein [Acidobacteriaceae bacterium]
MSAGDASIRDSQAAEHLHLLRALALELERAMNAIVASDIAELEDSLAQQQALSLRLTCLSGEWSGAASPVPAHAGEGGDPVLRQQVRSAAAAVESLNRRYAILLQHASRSVAMMVSLFRSFQGELQEGTGARVHHATWSCQG